MLKSSDKQTDQIIIPRCTKATVKVIVFDAKADVPYTVSVKFSNGINEEVVVIKGRYQGVLHGKSQI